MSIQPFALPPTRSVGQGNPPVDVNNIVLGLNSTGGLYNVLNAAYGGGADPTGAADSTTAIQDALTAAGNASVPGVKVVVPPGTYKTSQPLIVPDGVVLEGPQPNQQGAGGSTSQWGACFVPSSGFSGSGFNATAVILIQEVNTSTGTNRVHIRNIMIDGTSSAASVDGVATYGSVSATSVENVLCQFITGNSFACYNDGSGNGVDGLLIQNCLAQAGTGYGFLLTGGGTDLTAINCHAQSCGNDGWNFSGYNGRLIGCRSDLNGGNGFTFIGPSGSAGGGSFSDYSDNITFVGCGTQVNAKNGLSILDDYTGVSTPQPSCVIIDGCSFDMDGANAGSGGGGYAGIAVNGLAVVSVSNTRVMTDTIGAASGSPEYAIATSASANGGRVPISVRVSGASWLSAVTATISDAAPAANWTWAPDTLTFTGQHSSHITSAATSATPVPYWTAQDFGYAGIPFDPTLLGTSTRTVTAGVVYLTGVQVRTPQTIQGKVDLDLTNGGGTLTGSYAGLYNSGGTLLAASADQSSAWESSGWKLGITITAESAGDLTLVPGQYWVGLLVGTATGSAPSFNSAANSNLSVQQANGGRLTAANCRVGTYGTAATYSSLPTVITPGSIAVSQVAYWAGLY